jgi:hypothetical protein
VGVDLEISRPRDVLRIARFAFSKEEVAALEQQADSARDHLFYTLWTMKEAPQLGLEVVELVAGRAVVEVAPDGDAELLGEFAVDVEVELLERLYALILSLGTITHGRP